ncbi:MAG: energy transducer TonB [Pyrinomonadaceae bacterium]|nr:energy transducer TonB [Pyrinomonadaceae bacterium]
MKRPIRSLMQTFLLAACALMLILTGFDSTAQAEVNGDDTCTVQTAHATLQQKPRRARRRARTTRRPIRRTNRASVNTTTTAPPVIGVVRGTGTTDSAITGGPIYGAPNTDTPTPSGQSSTQKKPIMGGILNGKAISLPKPPYPAIARAARASGTVVVQVIVDETGKVISARAISGHPLLQQAAVKAAYEARFAPTMLSGQPVKVMGTISYNFVL